MRDFDISNLWLLSLSKDVFPQSIMEKGLRGSECRLKEVLSATMVSLGLGVRRGRRLQSLGWPKRRALSLGAQDQAARHTYAFVVVLVLETQAEGELGSRPEKPGGGLLTGGTRPGGGGGAVPFRSTTVLKPAGVAQHEPERDPPRPHSLLPKAPSQLGFHAQTTPPLKSRPRR